MQTVSGSYALPVSFWISELLETRKAPWECFLGKFRETRFCAKELEERKNWVKFACKIYCLAAAPYSSPAHRERTISRYNLRFYGLGRVGRSGYLLHRVIIQLHPSLTYRYIARTGLLRLSNKGKGQDSNIGSHFQWLSTFFKKI